MRHIPSTSGGGDSRPLVAVALGVAVVAAAFVVATGPYGSPGETETSLSVTATATPVERVPANATVHRHSSFELASPVHRVVKRADDANASATTNATVDSRSVVRLPEDARRTRYYVSKGGMASATETRYRVTVESTG